MKNISEDIKEYMGEIKGKLGKIEYDTSTKVWFVVYYGIGFQINDAVWVNIKDAVDNNIKNCF